MKKWMYNALIILFAVIFVGSAGYLAYYYINSHRQAQQFDTLAQLKDTNAVTPRPTLSETPEETLPAEQPPSLVEVTDPETGETLRMLPEFKELYKKNNHIVGWMTIPGTVIDYPVMQTPEQTDFYLKHNFERAYSAHGCLYAREVCDVNKPSDNITIYGHHMRDGSMFAQLDKYIDPAFCEENPYIFFDTLTQLHTYQIMAVFLTTATVGEGFTYHTFVDAESQEAFQEFADTCKALALYDTGVTAAYGDKFITLSTCEYSQANGRLVVVAKRVA